jgi:hypothetical protein
LGLAGIALNNVCSAVMPPAEAPMPTMGNSEASLAFLSGLTMGGSCPFPMDSAHFTTQS